MRDGHNENDIHNSGNTQHFSYLTRLKYYTGAVFSEDVSCYLFHCAHFAGVMRRWAYYVMRQLQQALSQKLSLDQQVLSPLR